MHTFSTGIGCVRRVGKPGEKMVVCAQVFVSTKLIQDICTSLSHDPCTYPQGEFGLI